MLLLSSMSSMLKDNLGLLEVLNPDISSMDNTFIKVVLNINFIPGLNMMVEGGSEGRNGDSAK